MRGPAAAVRRVWKQQSLGGKRRKWNGTEAYLAGVDLLAAESVVVGTHDGGR